MGISAPDIFISYASEDKAWVQPLAAALEATGRSVFWDQRIPPGENWHSHIGKALKAARCVVVVWSAQSVEADWVIEEANRGKLRRVLVPVFKEPVDPPMGFSLIDAADLSAWRRGEPSEEFTELLAALARLVGPEPVPKSMDAQPAVEVVPASPELPPAPSPASTAASPAPPPDAEEAKSDAARLQITERRRLREARQKALADRKSSPDRP